MNNNITFRKMYQRLLMGIFVIMVNVLSGSNRVYATHAAGTDLTYTYMGNNQYLLEVSFYRDCAGIDEPDSAAISCSSASCNQNFIVYALKVPGTGQEITTPCTVALTTCNGGAITGIKRFVYHKLVTLGACSDWVFSFQECCRNCAITTISNPCGNNSELYVEAKLNSVLAAGNSSPSFSNLPVAFVCVGQNFTYNHGVLDADGDSLAYTLITPKTSSSTTVSFISPATAATPLKSSTPFSINSITGDINFTSNALQIGVMAVLVREYRNGQLIGSVIRDMQVYTQNCSNAIPTASGIDSTNNFSVTVCPDQTLCFDIYSADADAAQGVTITTNNGIPGATYTISGGSRPVLHFCWTPTYADASLLPNTFTVTVRDNACPTNGIQTYSYSVFVPSPFFTVVSSPVSCNGGSNGSVLASPVYGNSYSYSWNTVPASSTASVSGLAAGVYTVTVSDNNQCSATASVAVAEPAPLSLNGAVSGLNCNGACNGSINLSTSGGTAPYSHTWSNGSLSEDQNALCAGSFTVTVTDNNGCSAAETYQITEPDPVTLLITGYDVVCQGQQNGLADLQVSGGSGSYSFNWSNGATTEDISGLAAGTYTVTVYDVFQCAATASVTIGSPAILMATVNGTDAQCNGGAGSADLSVSGGTPPFQFSWSNGETTEDISSLAAGTYYVSVYDAHQCMVQAQITILQPDALFANILSADGDCESGGGSADLTAGGGVQPYGYLWSNGATTEDLGGLATGTYTVTITDAGGCSLTASVSILAPGSLGGILFSGDLLCHGDQNGSIDLSVSGGIEPYAYTWSNGETTEDISALPAGVYTVMVNDGRGCSFTATVSINEPDALAATLSAVNALCSAGTGSVDLEVNGGTSPYSFLWSNGATTEDLQNLPAGSYSVTITDANGCLLTGQAEVSGISSNLQILAGVYHALCNGQADGAVSLQVSGGAAPYSFLWSDGSTAQDLVQASAGSYTVTVTDANGCTGSAQAEIMQPDALAAVVAIQNGNCNGSNSGSADLTVTGGTAPYSFLWSNGETSEDIGSLATGTYTVTVTDAHGCQVIANANIQNTGFSVSLLPTPAGCNGGNDGSVQSVVNGGTAPYSFVWSNGETTQDISSLLPGLYEVTVTDNNKCVASASILVTEPDALGLKIVSYPLTCKQDGSILTWVSGGTPPYSYLWSNGETTANISGLQAGFYTVTITDAHGCVLTASETVNPAIPMILNLAATDASYAGAQDGAIDLTVTGGMAPFVYNWSNGATTEDVSGLGAGTYQVTITDAQECQATAMVVIHEPAISGLHETNNGFEVLSFPNPATDDVTISLTSPTGMPISIRLYNPEGQLLGHLFNGQVSGGVQQRVTCHVRNLSPGLYFYTISTPEQQYSYKLLVGHR